MVKPGEAPPAWKIGALRYGTGLNQAIARKMLAAGEKESLKQGVPMAMAISDSGGNLLAFARMDDTMLCSTQIALDKAYTAVFGKLPTAAFTPIYKSGELIPLFFHERWITFAGGYPIIKEGVLIGGLGVSGGVIEDVYVARTMLKAGGFEIQAVDEYLKKFETGGKEG
ncbi:MAG TPA: heme-binding protein [Dehalococcoidales bacterium]|nr:heme-binding protein [Dehalococcoidales bacterium]